MDNKIEPYSPCPCNSGKKYKFCCYQKTKNFTPGSGALAAPVSTASAMHIRLGGASQKQMDEGLALLGYGVRLMNSGDYEQAIKTFQQVLDVAPIIHSAANNMSLCLMVTGRLDEAIRVQKKCLTDNPLPNPFGLANLVSFYHILGDDFRAGRYLKQAVHIEAPSADACVKVCEVLARFKKHEKIIEYADSTPYSQDGSVCFYTGIAAANLGDRRRAMKDLRRVSTRYHKFEMASRYLGHLREETKPHTIRQDWPYLLPHEICSLNVIINNFESEGSTWKNSPAVVDFCEAMLNEGAGDTGDITHILTELEHPATAELLWAIAKGSFGPDSLRLQAVNLLRMRGDKDLNEDVEILLDGKQEKINFLHTKLDSEFRFAKPLTPMLEKVYIQLVNSMESPRPDWKLIEKNYRKIARARPDFYPAQFNYAISLLRQGYLEESEPIIREIVGKYPEYLFARAILMQILLGDEQTAEAEELIKTVPKIDETHPSAMASWMIAQSKYYEQIGERDRAFELVKTARQFAPELTTVRLAWEHFKEMEE